MISFKQFLTEGGHATQKFNVERATQKDVEGVLKFVSKALSIPFETLKNDLLGSTELTLLGKKKDSGDVDIAFSTKDHDAQEINKLMLAATNGEGGYNAGTKVGSYAVPVGNKKIQTDLMYVNNKDWAKFSYHSAIGRGSEYPGAVRNIIMFTALAHTQKPGEDFIIRGEDGKAVVRASKSITMDAGMKRLFKMAKVNAKTGKYNKSLETVDPKDIEAHLKSIGNSTKFSHETDFTDDPDKVAEFIFGKGVKAKDIMTAEDVIKHVKKMKNSAEIIAASKSELERAKLPVPKEL